MRPLVVIALFVGCGNSAHDPAASVDGGADGNTDVDASTNPSSLEQGLLLATPDRKGPIEWIPVDDAGLHPKVTLVGNIDPTLRQSVWGFTDDGKWLLYGLDNMSNTAGSAWVRYLDREPQRIDDASKPNWYFYTWNNEKLFFVGASEVAFGVDLQANGVASTAKRVTRVGKRVFAAPISPSGDYIAMHYYDPPGASTPIIRVVQDMNALGTDMSECCPFGYYWDLTPRWGNVVDRQLMVAGSDYDHRNLSIAGVTDTVPTTVHAPPQHGGISVIHGAWSQDDNFIAYTVKHTIENLSHHFYVADVSGTPARVKVNAVHTNQVKWRPGTNMRHVAYGEYPTLNAQQKIMLATVETNPLRVTTSAIIEYAPSPIFGILYEWNADGTAILHHGGATGEYAVTFVDANGTTKRVPLGLFFRDEDSTRWTIPHLSWSKDGRRVICRTNTGFSIASIDVAAKTVSAPIALPLEIDFAWWDRRAK